MLSEPKTDREWQARMDAETLAQAEKIKADKARLEAAQKQAKLMANDKREEATAMSKIAGQASGTDDAKKPDKEPLRGSGNPFNIGVRIK
jgi:hypothetical protein